MVCVPGGPGQAVDDLGDLGGLSRHRTLILLDNRGTGASQAPPDAGTYRVDRLVDDVEALRRHLGLDRMDLLGHSASGGIGLLYAARYPERVGRLVLVAPSLRVVGIPSDLGVDEILAQRMLEPWYAEAVAALYADASSPQQLQECRSLAAPPGFYAGFEPDPAVRRQLAVLKAPVLLVAGEYDMWPTTTAVRELADLIGDADLAVLPCTGHFPWIDDPDLFSAVVEEFLARSPTRPGARPRRA